MERWSLSIKRCLHRRQKFLSSSFNTTHCSMHVITWIWSATFYPCNTQNWKNGIKLLVLSQRERICWVWIEMKKAWGRSNLLFLSTRRSNWEEENRLFRREWQGIRGGQTSVRGQLNLGCSRDKQEIEKPLVFKKNWRGFRKGENTWFQVKWRTIGEVKTFCFQVKWREIREGENTCFQS